MLLIALNYNNFEWFATLSGSYRVLRTGRSCFISLFPLEGKGDARGVHGRSIFVALSFLSEAGSVPLVGALYPFGKLDPRGPAEPRKAGYVQELARHAVGLGRVPGGFALEPDRPADRLGQLADRVVFSAAQRARGTSVQLCNLYHQSCRNRWRSRWRCLDGAFSVDEISLEWCFNVEDLEDGMNHLLSINRLKAVNSFSTCLKTLRTPFASGFILSGLI